MSRQCISRSHINVTIDGHQPLLPSRLGRKGERPWVSNWGLEAHETQAAGLPLSGIRGAFTTLRASVEGSRRRAAVTASFRTAALRSGALSLG